MEASISDDRINCGLIQGNWFSEKYHNPDPSLRENPKKEQRLEIET
uniref:Uncharacterized protein n=1 Tax=Siphoviridae sp. ctrpg19 TaxID=2826481 RepID=A0A8S5MLD6_9CAUD|nr:MAG TPA: hypothetical protein [Siphoviridae sp. ctrpg19]